MHKICGLHNKNVESVVMWYKENYSSCNINTTFLKDIPRSHILYSDTLDWVQLELVPENGVKINLVVPN